jgi:hypothetical protein
MQRFTFRENNPQLDDYTVQDKNKTKQLKKQNTKKYLDWSAKVKAESSTAKKILELLTNALTHELENQGNGTNTPIMLEFRKVSKCQICIQIVPMRPGPHLTPKPPSRIT